MKELDFFQINNFVKVQTACRLLRDCVFPTLSESRRMAKHITALEQYRDTLRPKVAP